MVVHLLFNWMEALMEATLLDIYSNFQLPMMRCRLLLFLCLLPASLAALDDMGDSDG